MSSPFVWFDNLNPSRAETEAFLERNFGWSQQNIGPMTFQTAEGEMPFAAVCDPMDGLTGWVPYIEVDDLAAETARAERNGATVIAATLEGPAGTATFLRDPGGAPLAIWKRGA
ncbi:VOC family protein [Cognatishimia activa]|uniref:VOC family protein n=1 Tax=Cognatishimia activa TaxID=1715691 RepID=UPI002230C896|nr:hypothetical protein [Cognatishimia activa]UZD90029.1 hypothetical protein M0D42_10550 [Cognatishimia activa]